MIARGVIPAAMVVAALAWPHPAPALETDQFYTWGRPLRDSTDVVNAKVNLEIRRALARVNRRSARATPDCRRVARRIAVHFRLFILHDLELWANHTALVDRIPGDGEEDLEFRRRYLYHAGGPLDTAKWIPPSPTIRVAGVRIGTDKLTHFFSEGWMEYRWYRAGLRRGLTREEASARALRRGLLVERTLLGFVSSGVFSPADLEANRGGMHFFAGLCSGEDRQLVLEEGRWTLARPFDFRDYVTPEWDESYQPSIFTRRRWRKVLPVMRQYCSLLDDPLVREERRRYAERDRETEVEREVRALVERGQLADPARFSIENNCPAPRER